MLPIALFRTFLRRCNTNLIPKTTPVNVQNTVQIPENEPNTALAPCTEDVSHVAPYLRPTFNFAAYVNKSETLQNLVKLGVDLFKLEQKHDPKLVTFIIGLNFDTDVKNHVLFLSDLGVQNDKLGGFITKNPYFFKEDLNDLQARINYLQSKNFTAEMVLRIVETNPKWLSFSTQEIDSKLGYFQQTFKLTGPEVRGLAARDPKLITYDLELVKVNNFVLKEEMGLTFEEAKAVLLKTPRLFKKSQKSLLKTFEYLHKKMDIPLERILQEPQILTCREFRLKQRHLFLEKLGRIQFDPKKPNYVSLLALVSGSDAEFVTNVAKSSIQTFNTFLKSL